jgi:putative transposase
MTKATLKARHHCVYALNYHLVLVTKYRKKCLTNDMLKVIEQSVRDRLLSRDGELIEFNGERDHIHALLSFPPHVAISEFVNALKTNTARILRRDFERELAAFYTEPVLWSRSYCAISVGGAPLEVLKTYIEQQDRPL